mgnify:CR=1 FL=1
MANLQALRGMHDILPEDAPLWNRIRSAAERVALSYDYHEIVTPIVENEHVFLRAVGSETDIGSKEMYAFDDRGGDRVALRPEGTAGVVRSYVEHGMASRPHPLRLWYFGPFFRYDRPQAGRYRQLWQFGVELIGDSTPAGDAEVIDLQHSFYEQLGLSDLTLRINSIGAPTTRQRYEEALNEHFAPHLSTLSGESQRRFETNILRVLDSKEDENHVAIRSAPQILDYLNDDDRKHFEETQRHLDALEIRYVVDPTIVRGLDYYTRTVWEFEPFDESSQSTVGAGGRYDGLIELLGGQATPAVGFGTGIERIALNLREQDLADESETSQLDAVMIPLGEIGITAAFKLAATLRKHGLHIRNGTSDRSLKAQLRSAGRSGARYALIIGEGEVSEGVVQVKAMVADGGQLTVPLDEVSSVLKTTLLS